MSNRTPFGPPTAAPKKTRVRQAKYFVATLRGSSQPVLVVAKSHKAAQTAMLTLAPATPADLVSAGKNSYAVVDTTVSNVTAIDAAKSDAA